MCEEPRFTQSIEDRQRQNRMSDLDRVIEPLGQRPLLAEAAMPFAVVVGDMPELPLRKFEIEQRQRGIGPGLGLEQSIDSLCLREIRRGRIALAQKREHACHQRGDDGLRAAKLRLKRAKLLILVRD